MCVQQLNVSLEFLKPFPYSLKLAVQPYISRSFQRDPSQKSPSPQATSTWVSLAIMSHMTTVVVRNARKTRDGTTTSGRVILPGPGTLPSEQNLGTISKTRRLY